MLTSKSVIISKTVALAIALSACEQPCERVHATRIAQTDLKSSGFNIEGKKITVRDEPNFWVVEHDPPPGGMGGDASQKIDKLRCTVIAREIGL